MRKALVIIFLLAVPSFALMLRQGIFTMHDFHVFRQFEFDKCVAEWSFPCRWAPDSSLGYGQPLFNYYGQFPYWLGTIFRFAGFSVLDAVKGVFILSLVASGLAMFVLAKKYWGSWGGLISATLYMYAPYRAVDVWVRGALPESLGFVFFPIIWLSVDNYLDTGRTKHLFWLILSMAALVITHNLSALMLIPFLGIWVVFRLVKKFSKSQVEDLISVGLVVFLLCAFYLLPVLFESKLVTLGGIAHGYYDYGLHFTSLRQLFWSNFWGYGGSIWSVNDGLSFAVGYVHWILPLVVGMWLVISGKLKKNLPWLIITLLGLLALFLTHGKSELIWKIIPPLKYLQFPWRFLSMAVFLLSLSAGAIAILASRRLVIGLVILIVGLNFSFFRPDIWRDENDAQYFSSDSWDQQRSSALSDYWPVGVPLPTTFAPALPQFEIGSGRIEELSRGAHRASYLLTVDSGYAKVVFPIVNFAGWTASEEKIQPDSSGLIVLQPGSGDHIINLEFKNTFVRSLGNWVSVVTLAGLLIWRKRYGKA